nr:PREDICTED: xyloside xylosyltransferase 1 [Bos mutus]
MQLIKFSEPVLMAWGFPRAPSAPDPGLQECPIQPVQKRDLQRRQMGSGASLLVTQGAQDSLTHCGKPWGGQKWVSEQEWKTGWSLPGTRWLGEVVPDGAKSRGKHVVFHDVGVLTDKLFPVVEAMQKHFSAGSGTYYSDSIFFLSVAMHQIMPKEILRIIQLDLDLKYKTNIRELFEEFDNFLPGAIIGIAREMQPVYRHTFWQFRHDNPKTRVGSPPPEGLPGFNSGVMLLNLEAMRQSPLYDRLLEPAQVQQLADKYHFRGHLGDQDFFTMIGMEHPELFHVLDCTWNRQLCTWWRDHGYSDVFDAYFRCEGHVKIYHGNCNTPIPEA